MPIMPRPISSWSSYRPSVLGVSGFIARGSDGNYRAFTQLTAASAPRSLSRFMPARSKGFFLLVALSAACRRPAEVPAAAPSAENRTLRMLLAVQPRSLDPQMPFDDVSGVVLDNAYDSLVRFDRSLRLSPGLALRWINPDD